jgi:hypothetical protein
LLAPTATAVLPPVAETISFVSDSSSDKSYVFIKGEVSSVVQSETVQLNGTTPVTTLNSYDTPLVIGKEITSGSITVTSAISNTLLSTMQPDVRSYDHIRFMLFRKVGEDITVIVHGKRKVIPLVHDQDKPAIRGCGQALVYMTLSEALPLIGGDAASAASYATRAEAAIKTLMDRELKQMSNKSRITPIITDFNGNLHRLG